MATIEFAGLTDRCPSCERMISTTKRSIRKHRTPDGDPCDGHLTYELFHTTDDPARTAELERELNYRPRDDEQPARKVAPQRRFRDRVSLVVYLDRPDRERYKALAERLGYRSAAELAREKLREFADSCDKVTEHAEEWLDVSGPEEWERSVAPGHMLPDDVLASVLGIDCVRSQGEPPSVRPPWERITTPTAGP